MGAFLASLGGATGHRARCSMASAASCGLQVIVSLVGRRRGSRCCELNGGCGTVPTNYDDIAKEPLPKRWVDLVHHLNETERRQRDAPARKSERLR